MNRLILFDFDGTITKKDSFLEFLFFYHGRLKIIIGLIALAPVLFIFLLKVISNEKAKQIILMWFFRNHQISFFNKKCDDFNAQVIPSIVRSEALQEIKEHQKRNSTIAVVTASPENWVRPWCDRLGVACIATRLEVIDSKLSGKINGRNCFGEQKAIRIKETFDLNAFDEVIAYGDSKGDREMFALATRHFYKPFRVNPA